MSGTDSEPDGIHSWQKHQCQDGARESATDQRVGKRSPEHGLGQRDERQNGR